jgi:TP901 family phage tail tape measure protein
MPPAMNTLEARVNIITKGGTTAESSINRIKKALEKKTRVQDKARKVGMSYMKVVDTTTHNTDKWGRSTNTVTKRMTQLTDSVSGKVTRSVKELNREIVKGSSMWGIGNQRLQQINETLNSVRWTFVNVTFALAPFIAGIIALTKLGNWAAGIERGMVKVSAVTKETAETVTQAALAIREGTIFSLEEVAEGMLEVSKKGFDLSETIQIVEASTILAVGGFTDLTTATETVTSILKLFNLDASESTDIVNSLSYVALNTAASVDKLSTALGFIGPLAKIASVEHEELAVVLGLLMDRGLRASKAATSLRGVLAKMINPSREVEEKMAKLGLSFFDADDNIKSLGRSMRDLGFTLRSMETQQEKLNFVMDLFGIRPASGAAALIDIMEEGSTAIEEMTAQAKTSTTAQEAFATQMEASANKITAANKDMGAEFLSSGQKLAKLWSGIVSNITATMTYRNTLSTLDKHLRRGTVTIDEYFEAVGRGNTGIATLLDLLARGYISQAKFNKIVKEGFPDRKEADEVVIEGAKLIEEASKKSMEAKADEGTSYEDFLKKVKKLQEAEEEGKKVKDATIDTIGEAQNALLTLIQLTKGYEKELLTQADIEMALNAIREGGTENLKKVADLYERIRVEIEETIPLQDKLRQFTEGFDAMIEGLSKGVDSAAIKEIDSIIEKFSAFLSTAKVLGVESPIENIINVLEQKKDTINLLNQDVEKYTGLMESARSKINELKNEISDNRLELSEYRAELNKVNKELSLLAKPRFVGQSAVQQLIRDLELYVKKQRLADFGIINAQTFLQDALSKTEEGYDDLLLSIDRVTQTTNSSKDSYEAWRETVKEFIRDTVEAGNILSMNVSGAVDKYSTLLLSTSKFGEDATNQSSIISLLRDAYDVHYGAMQNDVDDAIQAHEEAGRTVFNSSEQVITELGKQWVAQSELTKKVKEYEGRIKTLEGSLRKAQSAFNDYRLELSLTKQMIDEIAQSARKAAIQLAKLPRGSGISGGGGGAAPAIRTEGTINPVTGNPWGGHGMGDFIIRPNQQPIPFSKDDTVVGFKGGGGVGGVTINEINVSGVSGDPASFAQEFASELRRELRTL